VNYDPRYLAGVMLFNDRDFFEAHEVWEDLWMEAHGPERKFYQGLIQAAVGLLHFGNGNLRGAVKLYHSSRNYMKDLPANFLGMQVPVFLEAMTRCFEELLRQEVTSLAGSLDENLLPELVLDPPPPSWPRPADFVEHRPDS
jgi:predicted metal-dependent hydrolase